MPPAPRLTLLLSLTALLAGCIIIVPVPLPSGRVGAAPVIAAHPAAQVAEAPRSARAGPVSAAPASARCPAPARRAAMADAILASVNAERRAAGLGSLRASPVLAAVAQGHACDNAARGSYSHSGSDGSDLALRLRRQDYRMRMAAENTGWGFDDPARMMAFWMQSSGHRANILAPNATEAGLGLADGARPAWVLVLGRPK